MAFHLRTCSASVWLLVSVTVRSSALLAPLRYCFLVPGAGRSTRVSHIALALLDALVSSIAFSCLLRSLRALILLCPSATPQSFAASRLPGAAARRCVARVGRRGRRARSGGARGGGGAAGPDAGAGARINTHWSALLFAGTVRHVRVRAYGLRARVYRRRRKCVIHDHVHEDRSYDQRGNKAPTTRLYVAYRIIPYDMHMYIRFRLR